MHGDDIRLALYHKDIVLLRHSLLGQMNTIEFTLLLVYNGSRRIHIFLLYSLRGGIQFAGVKAHHFSTQRKPRKYNTTCKTVNEFAVALTLITKSHTNACVRILHEVFLLKTFLQHLIG